MKRFAGTPLKPVLATAGDYAQRGECIITARGIEGGVIYALSSRLRDEIDAKGSATLRLDLRPDVSRSQLIEKLSRLRGSQSMSSFLRKNAGLSPVAASLLREVGALPHDADALADRIKSLPIELTGTSGLERAISTAGGVARDALNDRLMAKHHPGIFLAGEMLDWEAPTGGYLLQACFATGAAAGAAALDFATHQDPP
jgi:uncharacterized flavoprotein (TIGR03862 family)